MSPPATEPTAIRSIAVSVEDVVSATEANRTSDQEAVLRVTPPFSGRMRARLHVLLPEKSTQTDAIHVEPETLLGAEAPSYPRPADTEDALRADPETDYSVETHRKRHEDAVQQWREAIPDAICEQVTLETSAGPVEVDVYTLG